MFFIAYAIKGQVRVFAGRVKIVSHSSCRTSTILNYFCPLLLSEYILQKIVKFQGFLPKDLQWVSSTFQIFLSPLFSSTFQQESLLFPSTLKVIPFFQALFKVFKIISLFSRHASNFKYFSRMPSSFKYLKSFFPSTFQESPLFSCTFKLLPFFKHFSKKSSIFKYH